MGAPTAENVNVAITGRVYVGAITTAAPTSAVSAVSAYTELGYVGPDGIEFTTDRSTKKIRAWQNSDLVRETITEATTQYKFTLLETTKEVIELYFGSAITSGKIQYNPANTGGKKSFIFDVIDGSNSIRHYVPLAEVMSIDPLKFGNGDEISYALTITAYAKAGRVADIYHSAITA